VDGACGRTLREAPVHTGEPMICESVPLCEVLTHIAAMVTPQRRAPVPATILRDRATTAGEKDGDAPEVVFLLVRRRPAAPAPRRDEAA
jgi:hypothetical protein